MLAHSLRHYVQTSLTSSSRMTSLFARSSSSLLKTPKLVAVGSSGLLVRFGVGIDLEANQAALALMKALDTKPFDGLVDLVPSYSALLIKFNCLTVSPEAVLERCKQEIANVQNAPPTEDREVKIPVKYGGEVGPDLSTVASKVSLSEEQVVSLHCEADYRVYFLGFMAGFPYLGGLSPKLASVPRLVTPRPRVEGGSVALAAGQTGVYSVASPGGWHVIGRTDMKLFDPTREPPCLLMPGDKVKFVDSSKETASVSSDSKSVSSKAQSDVSETPFLEVVKAGVFASVQDMGRRGYGRFGITTSGAADMLAVHMGAALLGNDPLKHACIEVTLGQASFRALGSCHVALTGADCGAKIGERVFPMNTVRMLQKGDVIELGKAKDGARTYIHVAGGVAVPVVLGSRSCDARAGMGRVLQAGDKIGRFGESGGVLSRRSVVDPLRSSKAGAVCQLRVLVGPGNPTQAEQQDEKEREERCRVLAEGKYIVSPLSDRMGVRLQWEGSSVQGGARPEGGQVLSEGLVAGSIQLPLDGEPILLLAEYQATGGYSVPAVVIEADLWRVGQLRAGDRVSLVPVRPEEAVKALKQLIADSSRVEEVAPERAAFNLAALTSAGDIRRKKCVDLNADTGEGYDDESIIPMLSSANLACGGHVGSPEALLPVVEMAARAGVAIGAHVSFVDSENFGRKQLLHIPPATLKAQVLWQAGSLDALCRGAGTAVRYIKPHGALYHVCMAGGPQALAVVEAARILGYPLLLMPGSPYADFTEGFAERAYDGNRLRDRSLPGALIHDPKEAAAQAVNLANQGIQSICVHGDSEHAVEILGRVREALEADGFTIRAFAPSKPIPEAYNDPRSMDRFYYE